METAHCNGNDTPVPDNPSVGRRICGLCSKKLASYEPQTSTFKHHMNHSTFNTNIPRWPRALEPDQGKERCSAGG